MSDILENLTSQIPPASPLDNLTIKEKHQLDGKIHRLGSFLFSALFLLVPLTFAPVLSDYFDFPKSLIIFILVSLATLLLLAKNLLSGKLFLPVSLFTWPIALLTLIAIVSSFLSDNRVIALTADTLLLCAMSALFFTLSSHDLKNKSFTQNAVTFLLLSGSLLSLLTLAEFVYSLVSPVFDLTINSPFLSPTFNPTRSPLSPPPPLAPPPLRPSSASAPATSSTLSPPAARPASTLAPIGISASGQVPISISIS